MIDWGLKKRRKDNPKYGNTQNLLGRICVNMNFVILRKPSNDLQCLLPKEIRHLYLMSYKKQVGESRKPVFFTIFVR